jgi:hypothetical protein
MLIYVTGYVQFSVFSSGHHATTLHIALSLKELGHTVKILNILDNNLDWYEDCKGISTEIPVIQKREFTGIMPTGQKADLLIDTMGCLLPEERNAFANKCALFIRNPPIFSEIENVIYPAPTLKRTYDNVHEIWTYDLFSKNDYQMLSILGQCPVRVLPFVWSPRILETFTKESGIPPWFATLSGHDANIQLKIAETNSTCKSSCTLPLVIAREFDKQNPGILKKISVVNGKQLDERKFFKDNIYAHIDTAVKPELEGRSRCVEWIMNPKSIVLSHTRFTPFRWMLFDCAWMGIPIIHNSILLKQLGEELQEFYYENNSVSDACAALKRCCEKGQDYWTEQRLMRTRYVIKNGLTIMREGCRQVWESAISEIMSTEKTCPVFSSPLTVPAIEPAGLKATVAVTPITGKVVYRMQFIGMWENFQSQYNFFTLLMENYFKSKSIDVQVIGCGSEYLGEDINIRICGPFGCKDPVRAGIPSVFTTGENIPPLNSQSCADNNIKLQLGFAPLNTNEYKRLPLWMMYINWFGADNERLVNPRIVPLEKCIKSHAVRPSDRTNFCAFIVTNPSNPVRNAAFETISGIGHVDSAGRYKNNCGDAIFAGLGGGGGEEKKLAFLENYRYNITYENSYGEGYVTEKLFHAKAAGCIPIYWGDSEAVKRDFDSNGFIDAKALSDEELVARIKWLESPEGAVERNRIAQTPMFSEEKAEEIRQYIFSVAERIHQISVGFVAAAVAADIKPVEKTITRQDGIYGRAY